MENHKRDNAERIEMLRKIFFGILILAIIKALSQGYLDSNKGKYSDKAMVDAAARINKTLPVSVAGGRLRLDKVEYANQVARYSGQQLWRKELTEQEKSDLKQEMKAFYCGEKGKAFVNAKISVEYAFKTQPTSLSDLSTETWLVKFMPKDCG